MPQPSPTRAERWRELTSTVGLSNRDTYVVQKLAADGNTVEKAITVGYQGIAYKGDPGSKFINLPGSQKNEQWLDVETGRPQPNSQNASQSG
jgi:hypothetical protein